MMLVAHTLDVRQPNAESEEIADLRGCRTWQTSTRQAWGARHKTNAGHQRSCRAAVIINSLQSVPGPGTRRTRLLSLMPQHHSTASPGWPVQRSAIQRGVRVPVAPPRCIPVVAPHGRSCSNIDFLTASNLVAPRESHNAAWPSSFSGLAIALVECCDALHWPPSSFVPAPYI
jgi:hypothetical protein